jgi:hypothetical protein
LIYVNRIDHRRAAGRFRAGSSASAKKNAEMFGTPRGLVLSAQRVRLPKTEALDCGTIGVVVDPTQINEPGPLLVV